MIIKIKKAQSTLEYAILIGVVVGALLSMQNFLKRSLQGKLQSVSDNLGDPYSPGLTNRTETSNSTVDKTVETTTYGITNVVAQTGITKTEVFGAKQTTSSTRNLAPLNEEVWPTNNK